MAAGAEAFDRDTPVRIGPVRVLHPPAPGPRWAYALLLGISAALIGLAQLFGGATTPSAQESPPQIALKRVDRGMPASAEFLADLAPRSLTR